MEYLRIKYPYAVDPFGQAFSLLGSRHHYTLEIVAKKIEGLKAEQKLVGEVSGIVDLLEPINGTDTYRLIDYKTFGSYAVAKHIGIKEGEADRHKLALQLNNYRLMAQDIGFNVVELKAQITVRDGGVWSSKKMGVDKNIYLVNVDILPDADVREYFTTKAHQLCKSVEDDVLPPMCGYEDNWGGRRCKGYCDISSYCKEGAMINKVEYKGDYKQEAETK